MNSLIELVEWMLSWPLWDWLSLGAHTVILLSVFGLLVALSLGLAAIAVLAIYALLFYSIPQWLERVWARLRGHPYF